MFALAKLKVGIFKIYKFINKILFSFLVFILSLRFYKAAKLACFPMF